MTPNIQQMQNGTANDADDMDIDAANRVISDDEYFPVIQYVCITPSNSDLIVNRRQPVLCPVCANEEQSTVRYYERDEQGVIHESQLITSGHESAHTECVNDDCDYETVDARQIRTGSYGHVIGPKKDYDRPRYDHSEAVRLNGGFEHAYEW